MNRILTIIIGLTVTLSSAVQAQEYRDTLQTTKGAACHPGELIRGRIAGVRVSSIDGNVNGETNLYVRGVNTLRGDSQPLWIVDDAILTSAGNWNSDAFWQYGEKSYSSTLNSLAYLPLYEIESIEVIKDMSATAKYGALGANGVVIVKTKAHKEAEKAIRYQGNVAVGMSNMSADIFAPAISHNHSIGTSGSLKNSTYSITAYYRQVNGIAGHQKANVGGAIANFETKANSFLWFGFHTVLSMGDISNVTGPSYFGQPSLLMLGRYPNLFVQNTEEGWYDDYDDITDDTRTTNSMFLTLNFTPKLKLNATIGADYRSIARKIWFGEGTSFGKEMNGAVSILSSSLFNYNGSLVLSYINKLGKNNLSVDLGIDAVGYINRFNTMNGTDFFTHSLRAEGLSIMGNKALIHSFDTDYARAGAYLSLGYDYYGYLGVDALLRADSSIGFGGVSPAFFPSINGFVDLKQIVSINSNILSSLKLTGGYGASGKDSYLPYQMIDNWLTGSYPKALTGQDCYVKGINSAISREYTVGIEAGFFGGLADFSMKYFNKNTDETFKIFDSSAKDYHGLYEEGECREIFSRPGSIANKGIETELSLTPIKKANLKWNLNANFTVCSNQITYVDVQETFGKKVGSNFYSNANAIGFPLGQLYGFHENEDGSYLDLNEDHILSEADKVLLGNTIPKYYGGLSSVLEVGSFCFDFLFDGAAGHYLANLNEAVNDRRTSLSDSYVEKADFLRLSHAAIAYTINPKKSKSIVKSVKVSATGYNLYTFSNYSGWNPDVNCFGRNVLAQGIDYGAYPVTRTVVLGVNIIF